MSQPRGEFDVFLSVPMAAFDSDECYQGMRAEAMRIVDCLEKECGLRVYYAGRRLASLEQFDEPDYAISIDIDVLKACPYFLLLYPDKVVSSVLVEAGMALVLEKKAVYFVRDEKHLPFMLRHLDRVQPVKIYEYRSVDRILKLLRDHKAALFEPWREAVPSGQTLPAAPRKIGPYTLLRELGRGQYGVVWLAERRSQITTQFAVKVAGHGVLSQQHVDALRREAKLWADATGHPNILPVIEAEFYNGDLAIVTQYMPDGSLDDWLARHGGRAPTPASAVRICGGILAGLDHLHTQQIVHRDLKPGNVLLDGENPRIADFGLARILELAEPTLSIGGTPCYMAPEAWDGVRSFQTDLWAVGVILYKLLTGNLPFPSRDLAEVRHAVRAQHFPPLDAAVSTSLTTVVARALQKVPADRYRTASEMLQELRKCGEVTQGLRI